MNEITRIHLGRQAYTIATDAHKELQEYLRAIKRHMGDTDEAVEEVELRMAELLAERGVTGDKVILAKDIAYLKEQLGAPGDFGDAEPEEAQEDTAGPKRLFRDTEHGMIAGVCAGVARYLGTDPVWVRLAFVALVLLGASGILLYIVMWLIIPEAKTKSERLQMQGRPVTVDALKEVVERADVKGAASRATATAGKVVQTVLKVVLVLVGITLTIAGVTMLMGLLAAGTYLIAHGSLVNNQIVFPVGVRETIAVVSGLGLGAILALLVMVSGLAMIRFKWPLPAWATASLVALFVVLGAVGTALSLDAAPRVSDRVNQAEQLDPSGQCSENIFSHCSYNHLYKITE